MGRLNYKPYFPKNDPYQLFETEYKNLSNTELNKWKNFKTRITKSEFIKNSLANKQSRICPICSKIINEKNQVVHHIDYERLCEFETYLTISSPTGKNKNLKIQVPNCENCPTSDICLGKVVLIHSACHMILHKQEGRIKKINNGIKKIPFPKKKKIHQSVPKNYWINKSSTDILKIVDEILNFMNELSENEVFTVNYNKFYIELMPENIVYFKPENNYLKIIISYGNFDKWLLKLKNNNINSEIKKRTSYRLSFIINYNQYELHKNLINNIIKDNLNKYTSNNITEYSPQSSQSSQTSLF